MSFFPDFLDQAQVVFHSGGLIFTDDYNFEQNDQGLWSGDHVMYARLSTLSADLPARFTPHPLFPRLFLDRIRISGGKAGWVMVTGRFVGILQGDGREPADDAPDVRYTLGISASEDPLETFGDYVDSLTPLQIQEASEWAKNPPKNDDGELQEPDTSEWPGEQVELYDALSRGLVSYRVARPTWTKSWTSETPPPNLNVVGKIDGPRRAPAASGGRNWLCVALTSVQVGNVYENEQVWELSGRGGWVERYYS